MTEMVTSVVTVLNQVICYVKLASITVYRILLWREVLPFMITDAKRSEMRIQMGCFCLGRMLKLKD